MIDDKLFTKKARDYYRKNAPLAERMRPKSLEDFVGQEQVVGKGRATRLAIDEDRVQSMILWGPPGTGKTTLGRVIADATGKEFIHMSAVTSGVARIKESVQRARTRIAARQGGTILFIDEIHRFNKAQQDSLLHHVEDGTLIFLGATTENPSFEVNAALLSRCKVVVLTHLDPDELGLILDRAMTDSERGLGDMKLGLSGDARDFLLSLSMGDARVLLNNLELAALLAESLSTGEITAPHVEEASGRQNLLYDKGGEEHFNMISALHKSMRGSDPQAAVYYLVRMLRGGEDPLYIARRMVRFASEDIGCADPNALVVATAALNAVHFLGMPECDTALAELAVYLATAPKSNRVYMALRNASVEVKRSGHLPVPKKIRNAPTELMKEIGYGKGYRYPHDDPDGIVAGYYLPDDIRENTVFYRPTGFGFEKEIGKRMEYWDRLRQKKEREG
jgi:putative ATPase